MFSNWTLYVLCRFLIPNNGVIARRVTPAGFSFSQAQAQELLHRVHFLSKLVLLLAGLLGLLASAALAHFRLLSFPSYI